MTGPATPAGTSYPLADGTRRDFQVQVRTTCLECGGRADDELCVGPYLSVAHVEFDPEEFMRQPWDDGVATFKPGCLPMVYDAEGNELPDHPVLKALRGVT